MATWKELADQNRDAAKNLWKAGQYRSSISRAYYAAYCLCTADLAPKHQAQFKNGKNNPSHDQLLRLVANNLRIPTFKDWQRRKIKRDLNYLRMARVDADYVPSRTVGRDEATAALMYLEGIFREL